MKGIFTYIIFLLIFQAEAQTEMSKNADSLYATGNYTKAINEYSKIGSEKASLQIARAYKAIGNFEKSVVQYKALVSDNPNLEMAQFELAKLYLKVNQFNSAKDLFSLLVQKTPENPEYHFYLGESFREGGDFKRAIPSFENAVYVDSTHLRSLFQMSKYYLVKGEKDSVLRYTDMGLKFYPKDVSLINLKALAYFNNDNFRNSIPHFEELLQLGETKTYVYQKLGYAYFRTWEFEKAKNMYKMAIGMEMDNPELYYELGRVYLKDRAMDSAQIFIQRAIELKKPNLASEYETLASIARQQEKLNEALEYYKLAHREDREEPRYYYQICAMNDGLKNNLKESLDCYESYLNQYGDKYPYLNEIVSKRISDLKAEIHFSKN